MPPKVHQVRYAVVGLGHIAQAAVLPAFANAENSRLAAIVSDDAEKRKAVAQQYDLECTVDYDDLEDLFERGEIDAVYIALPNHLHHEYVVRAANAGIHVLCEKPLAVTDKECKDMIRIAKARGVKLMTAYRLHFEKANLQAIEIAQSGKLGDLRLFHSVFNMQVQDDNVRLEAEAGGGTLYDIGIYCINAARNLFRDEPTAVQAWSVRSDDPRFTEVDEATSAILHFPGERLATFTCSFGAASCGYYQIIGTKGDLRVDPGYDYLGSLKHYLTLDGKTTSRTFSARDQFAPELIYFSDCILQDSEPEPSGIEGLADVRIIEALYKSAETGERISLPAFTGDQFPQIEQEITRPPVKEPALVNVESPTKS